MECDGVQAGGGRGELVADVLPDDIAQVLWALQTWCKLCWGRQVPAQKRDCFAGNLIEHKESS